MDQSGIEQSLGDELYPARLVQVVRNKSAAGLKVGYQRGTGADAIKIVDRQLDTGFPSDREQMEHRIG